MTTPAFKKKSGAREVIHWVKVLDAKAADLTHIAQDPLGEMKR